MEHHIMPFLLGTAQVGQMITKNTGVSIVLVAMLMGATYFTAVTFTSTDNRLTNMEEDIAEIKQYILGTESNALLLDTAIEHKLNTYEFEVAE